MSRSVYAQKKRESKPANAKTYSEWTALRPGVSNSAMLSMIGGGNLGPMSHALRERFEPAFKADFSNVRISRGRIPTEFGAEAFAQGTDIHLDSEAGDSVLGHELAHVVQQASGRVAPGGFSMVENASLEYEADVLGERAAAGGQARTGDFMSITPMNSPSAPIQAKKKKHKQQAKRQKQRQKQKQKKLTKQQRIREDLRVKRPWQITQKELEANRFNPNQDDDLQKQLDNLEKAVDPTSAVKLFHKYSGNQHGQLLKENGGNWDMGGDETDLDLIKTRLKNMSRMVRDYPELKGKIGNIKEDTEDNTSMSATSTLGGNGKSDISWNVQSQKKGILPSIKRKFAWWGDKLTGFSAAKPEYDGNHELGHTLNSLLIDKQNIGLNAKKDDWRDNTTAEKITKKAVKKVGNANSKTSGYGGQDSGELFAEAFADVYENGENARPLHKEIVKQYEKMRGQP